MLVIVYREAGTPHEHCAMVYGELAGREQVLARVHSECFTGEVLHSLKCDCRQQLDHALRAIADEGAGVVIYLRQEGRGIGLGNKIRAYALQDQGADTVDANRLLGFEDDLRQYDAANAILRDLDVRSVRLMTNNPEKVEALRAEGTIVERVPVRIEPGRENRHYLQTKRRRMGHLP
jgi:GTP cyclohydrolase II